MKTWFPPVSIGLFLEKILVHFKDLNIKYDFESLTMTHLTKKLKHGACKH